MSYSRIKVWIAAEILTASDLNTEFSGNITNENDLDSRLITEIATRATLESEYDTFYGAAWNAGDSQIATNKVALASMKDNSVGTSELVAQAVTRAKLHDDIVDPAADIAGARTLGEGSVQAMAGNAHPIPPADSITFEKIQHGTIMVGSHTAEQSGQSAAWEQISPTNITIYIPSDATKLEILFDIKSVTAFNHLASIRFTVQGNASSVYQTPAKTNWYNEQTCYLDVSGLSGRANIEVQATSAHDADATYHVRNLCMYWE